MKKKRVVKAFALITPMGKIIDLKNGYEIYPSRQRIINGWEMYKHLIRPVTITYEIPTKKRGKV